MVHWTGISNKSPNLTNLTRISFRIIYTIQESPYYDSVHSSEILIFHIFWALATVVDFIFIYPVCTNNADKKYNSGHFYVNVVPLVSEKNVVSKKTFPFIRVHSTTITSPLYVYCFFEYLMTYHIPKTYILLYSNLYLMHGNTLLCSGKRLCKILFRNGNMLSRYKKKKF